MARDDGEQQAMSSERLAHWHWVMAKHSEPQSMSSVVIDVRDLAAFVAEVERQRAALAALVDMLQRLIRDADATYVDVRPYAGLGHTKIFGPFPNTLEQARALLASTDERSGGDGA